MERFLAAFLLTLVPAIVLAETTCYGEGSYRVCTTTTYDANGNISIRSRDSMGNSYSLSTESYTSPDGHSVIGSRDSLGNSYKVESWSDERGYHSRDSMGNICTITHNGKIIGCD